MILRYDGARGTTFGYRLVRRGRLYKRRGFDSRQAAQDAEDAQRATCAGAGAPATDLPWTVAVDQYRTAKAGKADLDHDERRLAWWGRFLTAHHVATLRQVTPELLDAAKLRLKHEAKAPATIVRYLAVLRHLFRQAIRRRWAVGLANPTEAIDWPAERPVPRRVPTAAELRRLVRAAEPVVRPLILVAVLTGLRRASILGLTPEDTRMRTGLLRVVQKGGRELWLPMTPGLEAVLRRPRGTTGPLWRWPDGRVMTRFPRKAWHRSLARAGLAPFGFHALRHAVGELLTEAQTSGRVVQAVLGHSSGRMTERYTRPRDPALVRAQTTLAGLLRLPRPVPPKGPSRRLTSRHT